MVICGLELGTIVMLVFVGIYNESVRGDARNLAAIPGRTVTTQVILDL